MALLTAFMAHQRPADDDTWKDLNKPFEFVRKNSAEQAMRLEYLRECRTYKTQLGLTWSEFCVQYADISCSHANSMIRRREVWGDAYFRLTLFVRISPSLYRRIVSHVNIDGVEIDGRRVPLTWQNTGELSAVVRRLRLRLKRVPKARRRATAPCSVPLP
jgi:hypothetical protein